MDCALSLFTWELFCVCLMSFLILVFGCVCNSWYVDEGLESSGTEKAWKGESPKEFPVGQEVILEK